MAGGEVHRIRAATRPAAIFAACIVLAGCASSNKFARMVDPRYGVASSPRVVDAGQPVPKGGGVYRVGKPYTVAGQVYVPEENPNYRVEGMASWYGDDFHGRLTANGEVFDMQSISAAHPTLPLPSYARVTNIATGKSIIVRVNDRGPFHSNRVIDLSHRTATLLGFKDHGVARVRVEYVGRAPLEGSDDRMLVATLRHGVPAPAPSPVMLASAKPFVGSPDRAGTGNVPVPGGRPYTLGQDVVSEIAQYRGRGVELSASRSQADRTTPSLAAAYAPPRPADTFMSGRGLY
ncbi:MAG: septal ring lytic transglycosylase RlpA family protein [Pseudorhodoplanes sp.]|nr:septal ring lytic transglycosylase RlpA family protein [Pseudorhodoplanes sp.]